MRFLRALIVVGGILVTSIPVYAQPINDDKDFAIEVTANSIVFGANEGATIEDGEPEFASGRAQKTVWWRYKAPLNGIASIVLTGGGNSFSRLAADVFEGPAANNNTRRALSIVETNRSLFIHYARLQFSTTKDRIYYIRVGTLQTSSWIPHSAFNFHLIQHGPYGGTSILPVPLTRDGLPFEPSVTWPPSATNVAARESFSPFVREYNYSGDYFVLNSTNWQQRLFARTSNRGFGLVLDARTSIVPRRFAATVAGFRGVYPGIRFMRVDGAPGYGQRGSIVGVISAVTYVGRRVFARRSIPVAVHRYDKHARLSLSVSAPEPVMVTKMGTTAQTVIEIENGSSTTATGCRIFKFYDARLSGLTEFGSYGYNWRVVNGKFGAVFNIRPGQVVPVQLILRPHFVGTNDDMGVKIVCNNHQKTSYRIGLSLTGTEDLE